MRAAIVVSTMSTPGGTERVAAQIASYFARTGWQTTAFSMDSSKEPFYDPRPAAYSALGLRAETATLTDKVLRNLHRVRALRHSLKDNAPEVILSMGVETNVLVLIAGIGLGIPVVVAERNDPRFVPRKRIWRMLRGFTYLWARHVIVQNEAMSRYFGLVRDSRKSVLPTPLRRFSFPDTVGPGDRGPGFVTIASLTPKKRIDRLLRAFSRVEPGGWRLVVVGDGPLRGDLERLAADLGIADSVCFEGVQKHPERWLAESDIFVMSSDYEGIPNALCEAMACGLPVVATESFSSVHELVGDGGLVVPCTVDGLARGMNVLADDESLRQRMGEASKERMAEFDEERVIPQWQSVLSHCVDPAPQHEGGL